MSVVRETGTYLDRILVQTQKTVQASRERISDAEMRAQAEQASPAVDLVIPEGRLGVIAEFKRASPSKGRFPVEMTPEDITESYITGGVTAISCLTDEPFFQGSLTDLDTVVAIANNRVPVLRKDFTIDPYQIDEARAHGASMILLIVAVLDDMQLRLYREHAESLGMQALVEVHDEAEAERAVTSGARIIGINNRDLRTFNTDLRTTERIAPQLPAGTIIVGESGIHSVADAQRMAAAGCHLLLVGESLIVREDREQAIDELTSVRLA